jgi:type IV secretory pathway VirB2 component (pilin)
MQEQAQQYAIGWGTLSLINAGLAQSKGRSGLLWWLFSLILGPLATFLIVVLPAVVPTAVVREREDRPLSSTR